MLLAASATCSALDSSPASAVSVVMPSFADAMAARSPLERATPSTAYPSAASLRAVAAPMPRLAPVTTATPGDGRASVIPRAARSRLADQPDVEVARAHAAQDPDPQWQVHLHAT